MPLLLRNHILEQTWLTEEINLMYRHKNKTWVSKVHLWNMLAKQISKFSFFPCQYPTATPAIPPQLKKTKHKKQA